MTSATWVLINTAIGSVCIAVIMLVCAFLWLFFKNLNQDK